VGGHCRAKVLQCFQLLRLCLSLPSRPPFYSTYTVLCLFYSCMSRKFCHDGACTGYVQLCLFLAKRGVGDSTEYTRTTFIRSILFLYLPFLFFSFLSFCVGLTYLAHLLCGLSKRTIYIRSTDRTLIDRYAVRSAPYHIPRCQASVDR
jgi:hypothetical protein